MSRRHAEIFEHDGRPLVRDLSSTNGIYLNGIRVDEAPLWEGDMLQIGRFRFRFSFLEPDAAVRAVAPPCRLLR